MHGALFLSFLSSSIALIKLTLFYFFGALGLDFLAIGQ